MFDSIDFKGCEVLYRELADSRSADLLRLRCPNGRVIVVGWDGAENQYGIHVAAHEEGNLCYKVDGYQRVEAMEQRLQSVIDYETAVFDPCIQGLFDRIIGVIDDETSTMDMAVRLLESLRDAGLSQDAVADYISIYAMRYYDDVDQERWDFVCDMLDRITGWCTPDQHIWRGV